MYARTTPSCSFLPRSFPRTTAYPALPTDAQTPDFLSPFVSHSCAHSRLQTLSFAILPQNTGGAIPLPITPILSTLSQLTRNTPAPTIPRKVRIPLPAPNRELHTVDYKLPLFPIIPAHTQKQGVGGQDSPKFTVKSARLTPRKKRPPQKVIAARSEALPDPWSLLPVPRFLVAVRLFPPSAHESRATGHEFSFPVASRSSPVASSPQLALV